MLALGPFTDVCVEVIDLPVLRGISVVLICLGGAIAAALGGSTG